MDFKKQIKTLLQEAEIYRSQGLSQEASQRYHDIVDLIKTNPDFPNSEKLLESIEKKVNEAYPLEDIHGKVSNSGKMSTEKQEISKNEFLSSGGKDASTLEGAIALARFGQYKRSLSEFAKLLNNKSLRVIAAKNILRCHIAIASVDDAIAQYEKWVSDDTFPTKHVEKIKVFLEGLLEKKNCNTTLSAPIKKILGAGPAKESISEELNEDDEDFLDINSIGIVIENGPKKGKVFEFAVNLQSGNQLNFIISGKDQDLINSLNEGQVLNNTQFFTPISILKSSCVISSKIMISSGTNKEDCSLDIKVLNE